MSPSPSPITQRSPSARTRSRPLLRSAGLSGPTIASPSKVQSPTSCCSHLCSLVGSVCIEYLLVSRSVVDRLIGQSEDVAGHGRQHRRIPRALGQENRHHLLGGIAAPRGTEAAVPAVLPHRLAGILAPRDHADAEAPTVRIEVAA